MVRKKHIGMGAIAVIIIIVAAVVLVGVFTGAVGVSGPTKLTLTSNPTVVKLQGSQYVLLLSKADPASDTAYILIGKSPIFVSPTLNVTVMLNNFTKINAGTDYANMELYLDAVTNSSASVTLTPIQTYLNEQPDSGRITVVSTTGHPAISITISVASTTVASTTTVNETLTAEQRIKEFLTKTEYYPLMANYSADFANTANCTGDLYNTSYRLNYKTSPSGPTTYQNVTLVTPHSMIYNITNAGNNEWSVTYSTLSDTSFTTGPALTLIFNLTSGLIVNKTYSGAWKGQSYASLKTGLGDAASVGNACGILVYV